MDFTFTQEQQQFADALRRWVDKDYSFDQRRKIIESSKGVSDAAWDGLAELGMLALPVPAAQGGFDGTAVDMSLVMQEIGRGLIVEPYFSTVLGAQFLKMAGDHAELLTQVAAGKLKLACALGERHSRHELRNIATTANANARGYRLDGVKTVVLHGAQADALIVSARSYGEVADCKGISLFVLASNTPGVTIRDYRTIDGQRAADITLNNVQLSYAALVDNCGAGWRILETATDYGTALLCAEAVGAMDAIFGATLEYVKTRQQFGTPIGKFQALQHRLAEMFIELEQARSMMLLAAVKVASSDPEERRRMVSAAKVRVSQAARFIGQQAVQLHGGMGVTNELPAAHHFKRLTTIGVSLGDADHHLARFIAQDGFQSGAIDDA
ncbi:MAG: acyl-CoA dehydrogenase family protein [Pseudomonadota bacterium]